MTVLPYTKPTITEALNSIVYEWAPFAVKIRADRVESEGKAELWFYHCNGSGEELLHTAQVNLMASTTMTALAKRMAAHSEEIPWPQILTCITATTIQMVRRGDPVRDAETCIDVTPPRLLLDPFVVEHYPNVIFGDPGTMKSNFALVLSQVAMTDWGNSIGLSPPSTPLRVLYLDWETDFETVRWQLKTLQQGMKLPDATFVSYRRCSLPLALDVQTIADKIKETKADMIIIDSLGLACAGELSKEQSPLAFFSALRQLNTTSLILAHNSKGDAKQKSIYGSMFFHAQARNIWEIRKSQSEGSSEAGLCLFHVKSPPFLGLQKPRAYKLKFTTTTMHIAAAKAADFQEFVENMSVGTQIILALRNGPMTGAELTKEGGIEAANIYVELDRLLKKGQIVKLSEKRWGLASRSDNSNE